MRIAFVSRELHPLCGGGIGVQVAGASAALAEVAEVTVVTSSTLEPAYRRLADSGHPAISPDVRVAFVEEPSAADIGSFYSRLHLYSARVHERLRELYPEDGPDLIEFSDFLGEGVVAIQARRAREPRFRHTGMCVRLHTSAEICAVLNGCVDDCFEARMTVACERYPLRHADRLISPGDDVLETYRRFYGVDALAPAATISPIPAPPAASSVTPPPPAADGVRFLYMGRLECRKGVQDMVRAFSGLEGDSWSLTLVGGDTASAPNGTSMRDELERATGGDPRIELKGELPRDHVRELIDAHHVVLVPSRWECWPNVLMEALERNRPVLATPVGGMPEMLEGGHAGWLTSGVGEEALTESVECLLGQPELIDATIAAGGARRAHRRLTDPSALREAYLELAASIAPAPASVRSLKSAGPLEPLVSVVMPYRGLDRFVEDAVRSVFDQDHRRLELILVNDGSFEQSDARVLDDLVERFPIRLLTQERAGSSRARNAGIVQARGRYVLPLDADRMLHRSFVKRCVDVLAHEPEVAFATTWAQYVDEHGRPAGGPDRGLQPLGNGIPAVMSDNVAGDATALIRKDVFERGHRYDPELAIYEDWQLYRELHQAGLHGVVIPERLLVCRMHDESTVEQTGPAGNVRAFAEMQARLKSGEVEWLCAAATAP